MVPCEGCGRDINCNRENLHILTKPVKPDEPIEDLTHCVDCCYDRDDGWKCDQCDDNSDEEEEEEEEEGN